MQPAYFGCDDRKAGSEGAEKHSGLRLNDCGQHDKVGREGFRCIDALHIESTPKVC